MERLIKNISISASPVDIETKAEKESHRINVLYTLYLFSNKSTLICRSAIFLGTCIADQTAKKEAITPRTDTITLTHEAVPEIASQLFSNSGAQVIRNPIWYIKNIRNRKTKPEPKTQQNKENPYFSILFA